MPEPASAAVTAAKAEARPVVPPPDLVVEEQVTQTMAVAPEAPAAAPQPESARAQRDESSTRDSAALSKEEADATTSVDEVAVTSTRARRGPGRTAGPRGTISSMSGAAASESRPASDDERADRSDPAAWLEDIRDLRRAGKSADADREWDLFRKAFPDFEVADDDLARRKP